MLVSLPTRLYFPMQSSDHTQTCSKHFWVLHLFHLDYIPFSTKQTSGTTKYLMPYLRISETNTFILYTTNPLALYIVYMFTMFATHIIILILIEFVIYITYPRFILYFTYKDNLYKNNIYIYCWIFLECNQTYILRLPILQFIYGKMP